MGYYAQNPYEEPEPPRCFVCDEIMDEEWRIDGTKEFVCHNPECIRCPERWKCEEEEMDE